MSYDEYDLEDLRRETAAAKDFYNNSFYFRDATVAEYALWLRRWIEQGNANLHRVNRLFGTVDRFKVPVRNVTLIQAYGANSVNLLVPPGVKVSGQLGHGTGFITNKNGESCMNGLDFHFSHTGTPSIFDGPEFDMSRVALVDQCIKVQQQHLALLLSEKKALTRN